MLNEAARSVLFGGLITTNTREEDYQWRNGNSANMERVQVTKHSCRTLSLLSLLSLLLLLLLEQSYPIPAAFVTRLPSSARFGPANSPRHPFQTNGLDSTPVTSAMQKMACCTPSTCSRFFSPHLKAAFQSPSWPVPNPVCANRLIISDLSGMCHLESLSCQPYLVQPFTRSPCLCQKVGVLLHASHRDTHSLPASRTRKTVHTPHDLLRADLNNCPHLAQQLEIVGVGDSATDPKAVGEVCYQGDCSAVSLPKPIVRDNADQKSMDLQTIFDATWRAESYTSSFTSNGTLNHVRCNQSYSVCVRNAHGVEIS